MTDTRCGVHVVTKPASACAAAMVVQMNVFRFVLRRMLLVGCRGVECREGVFGLVMYFGSLRWGKVMFVFG